MGACVRALVRHETTRTGAPPSSRATRRATRHALRRCAAGNNIGKALQKQATRTLPRLTLRGEVMAQYATSGTWLLGMATDLGGALLMIAAFARAPVSVVQPVSSVGLVFLMLFSHFYLKVGCGGRRRSCGPLAWFGRLPAAGASSGRERGQSFERGCWAAFPK